MKIKNIRRLSKRGKKINLINSNKSNLLKIFQLVARLLLGGIFIYASIDKIAFPSDFVVAIQGFDIIPSFLIKPIALILPWIELIVGILLVVGLFPKESAFVLTSLLIVFLIAIGFQATKGPIEDCGCFTKGSILSSNNIVILIIRDLIFIALGLFILIIGRRKIVKRS